jgi:hypothetical protein
MAGAGPFGYVGRRVLGDLAAVTGLAALVVDTELEAGEVDGWCLQRHARPDERR